MNLKRAEEEKIQRYNEQLKALISQIENEMGIFKELDDSGRDEFFKHIKELDLVSEEAKYFIKGLKRSKERPVELITINKKLINDIERIKKSMQNEYRLRSQK